MTQVTVRATVLLLHDVVDRLEILAIDLDVPADGAVTVRLGVRKATLLTLRIVDVRLKAIWSD